MKRMITRFTRGTPCSKTPLALCTPRELTFFAHCKTLCSLEKTFHYLQKEQHEIVSSKEFSKLSTVENFTQTTLHKPGTSRSVMHTIFGTTSNCSPLLSLAQHTAEKHVRRLLLTLPTSIQSNRCCTPSLWDRLHLTNSKDVHHLQLLEGPLLNLEGIPTTT